jgi:hypothetical protein
MPFLAACPFCERESHVPDCARGTSTECPHCARVFTREPKNAASARHKGAPFRTVCSRCGHQSHVPHSALGARIRCARCFDFFTVARKKRRTDRAVPALAGGPARAPADCLPGPVEPWWVSPVASPPESPAPTTTLPASAPDTIPAEVTAEPRPVLVPAHAGAAVPSERPEPSAARRPPKPQDDEEQTPRAIDPLGAGALFLGCAALWCAWATALCGFVIPLSGAALLAGMVALVRAVRSARSRLTFPGASVALAVAVLVLAMAFPGLLGPAYLGFKGQRATDPTAVRRLPLPGKDAGPDTEDPEWADASRTALQQGQVTLQVAEVKVAPRRLEPAPSKTGKESVFLVIRLRVRQVPQPAALAKTRDDTAALKEKHRPTVTDPDGKVYELLEVQAGGAAEKTRGPSAFGLSSRELVFEAPAADVRVLRLEVPAAAWGGRGTFRFRIPGPMIRRSAGG